MKKTWLSILALLPLLLPAADVPKVQRFELENYIVNRHDYEINVMGKNKWNIYTNDTDAMKKWSGGIVIQSPFVKKDNKPGELAPVLKFRIPLPNGRYDLRIYLHNRPIGISLDGGKTFRKLSGRPVELGRNVEVTNGALEFQAACCYANPKNPGWSYIDCLEVFPAGTMPVATRQASLEDHPDSYYRIVTNNMKLLPLADKGLDGRAVEVSHPLLKALRPQPEAAFPQGSTLAPQRSNHTLSSPIRFRIAETSNVDRPNAAIRTGVPFPKGTFFSLPGKLLLTDAVGKTRPFQLAITAYWPDGSVKWGLLQFQAPFQAGAQADFVLQEKNAAPTGRPGIRVTREANLLNVDTGAIQCDIDVRNFNLLREVRNGTVRLGGFAPEGITVTAENGTRFCTAGLPPEKVEIEENGPEVVTIKAVGSYAHDATPFLRYVTRLRFRAASPEVEIIHTHLNTNLRTEFTDIASLSADYRPAAPIASVRIDGSTPALPFSALQSDERTLLINRDRRQSRRGGLLELTLRDGTRQAVAIRDAAKRYPKGYDAAADRLRIDLLPPQPGPDFGSDLPAYLRFPFCGGFYRTKWGMAFTETIRLNFADAPASFAAETDDPLIAVIDRDALAASGAMPGVTPNGDRSFDAMDQATATGIAAHLRRKELQREYGFLNYGDWYGERGRNWGNNEYDLANGLYFHFARTGNLAAARLAAAAARHQADVDLIHAYRDPYYVGANAQHGICHTGVSYQGFARATWSYKLDVSYSGEAGHTWLGGMLKHWHLTGDPVVMDGALKLGEHLLNFTAPGFVRLGTHERSAGWSLHAIMTLYHTTGDPACLKAARKIVDSALREQNRQLGGAWPHVLPPDHANNRPNMIGNCPYLIGILLHGIYQVYLVDGSNAEKNSLIDASRWLLRVYGWEESGWPYAVTHDNRRCHGVNVELNSLIAPAVMAAARLADDPELARMAQDAFRQNIQRGFSPVGKNLAQQIGMSETFVAEAHRYMQKHPEESLPYTGEAMLQNQLNRAIRGNFRLRGGFEKQFQIRLLTEQAVVTLHGTPYGNRPDGNGKATIRLCDASGTILREERADTRKGGVWKFQLTGRPGTVFTLQIRDDMGAVYHLAAATPATADVTVPLQKDQTAFGAAGKPVKFALTIPRGVRYFTVIPGAVHSGGFGAAVVDEQGKMLGSIQEQYAGDPRLPWIRFNPDEPHEARLTIDLGTPADATRHLQLYCWSAWDFSVRLEGLPPELRSAD